MILHTAACEGIRTPAMEEYLCYVKCLEILLTMQHTRHDHIDPVWNETKDMHRNNKYDYTHENIRTFIRSIYFYHIIIVDYRYIDYYL